MVALPVCFPMALTTRQETTCKQQCNQIRKFCRYGKTSRRSAGTSSSVGSTTRNKQSRVNAALNGPATNCLRERNDLAAGRVAFTAPTRLQADGNKQS